MDFSQLSSSGPFKIFRSAVLALTFLMMMAPSESVPVNTPSLSAEATSSISGEARMLQMQTRIEQLETLVKSLTPARDSCEKSFPNFGKQTVMAYDGCDSDVKQISPDLTNISCQNGTITFFDRSGLVNNTQRTGLFDIHIDVNNKPKDVYYFVCTVTKDQPHTAQCSLTNHVNSMAEHPQGPAWINLFLHDMSEASHCAPQKATIAGTYFWATETHSTGVYSFYANLISHIPS